MSPVVITRNTTMKCMRNKSVDILRSIALCMVIIYHIWVSAGSVSIDNEFVFTLIRLGGEIGVTLFFVISGFGIFHALYRMDQNNNLRFLEYFKKRMLRIAPEYYLSLLGILLLVNGDVYFNRDGIDDILTHLTFTHNYSASTAGTINGVLWTMSVTVQFYVVAIILYKILRKYPKLTAVAVVGLTVLSKGILLHYGPSLWKESSSFWLSRQILISVIDNFVLGMYVANLLLEEERSQNATLWKLLAGILLAIITLYGVSILGLQKGIHTDNISGYTWHSLIAVCLAFAVYCCAKIHTAHSSFISKGFLWLAKYEYGIYIVHLYTINFLLESVPAMQSLNDKMYVAAWGIMFVSCVVVGYVFSVVVKGIRQVCAKICGF